MDNPSAGAHIRYMMQCADILIVGGGLNGPLQALALAQAGFSVIVIDAQAQTRILDAEFDGRSYALALTSVRMLRHLGLWGHLDAVAQPILEIKVSDGRAGTGPSPFFMHFDHAEIEEGPMGHMVEDRHLRPVLLEALAAHPNIAHLSEIEVVGQSASAQDVTLDLADGRQVAGDLVIGADGRRSGTAQRAAIKRTGWDYGQTALVCAIAHERPHQGIAHQFFMPPGPLAILPLTGHRSSIVWSERKETAAAFRAFSDERFLTMLQPRFGDFLGKISLAGARHSYPLSLSLATRMIAPRTALVGDAAHGVHPIAGQGLNAGLRDIAALTEVLTEARARGEDFASAAVLGRFEEWRRFDNTALGIATDTFNRLFSNDNSVLRGLRGIGMGLVSGWPGLRRGFIREAAGLTGTLPRLMRD